MLRTEEHKARGCASALKFFNSLVKRWDVASWLAICNLYLLISFLLFSFVLRREKTTLASVLEFLT